MTINKDGCVAYIDFEHSDTYGIKNVFIEEVPTEELKEALQKIEQELKRREALKVQQ